MTRPLDDRVLDALLDRLPTAKAPEDFAEQVFGRLARRRARGRAFRGVGAVAAAAVLLTASLWSFGARRDDRATQREVAALRAEILALRQELGRLEVSAEAARPVLYLGSTDEVDVVLDLRRLARADRAPGAASPFDPRARPAVWRRGDPLRASNQTLEPGDRF